MKNYSNPVSVLLSGLGMAALCLGTQPVQAVLPEPGNIYYGLAKDMLGSPIQAGSDAQVVMVRMSGTNEVVLATSEILASTTPAQSFNYILRPTLDDGFGTRFAMDAGRSNEVVRVYVVLGGLRYPVTPSGNCAALSDPVPRLGGRGAVNKANLWANDDSDGDCLSNAWEVLYWGDSVTANPLGDDDGDGLTNLQEFRAVTNPREPDAGRPPTLLAVVTSNAGFLTLDWNRDPASRYTLEWSSSLAGPYTAVPVDRISGANANVLDVRGVDRSFIRLRIE